jgi:hypothetical protein
MAYIDIAELQRVLGKPTPTAAETAAMQRCLDAAAEEIDWTLGYSATAPAPIPPPSLVAEVNLERAEEHWKQSFSPSGVIRVGTEEVPIVQAADSWRRHALKLQSLKMAEGIA